jgi:hypothetical protein
MPDQDKFTEDGLKLEASVASTMAEMLPAAGPVGTAIATIIGAAGFVAGIINWMKNDTSMPDALRSLQNQIDQIKSLLVTLSSRMDELVEQVAVETNRTRLTFLMDYLDEIRNQNSALRAPALDQETSVRIANESGVTLDKFLRNDFDVWRWTDVVQRVDENGQHPALAPLKFKNLPTLTVYLMAVLTWLAARERVVQMGQRSRLEDDAVRLSRHLNAVSVRPGFDKYQSGDAGRPMTIAEHIKSRIRAFANASTRYPVNRFCQWYFDVQNWMNGSRKNGDAFDVLMESDNILCTIDPARLGSPPLELAFESEAGLDVLQELATTLERVAATGTLREPFIGEFPPPGVVSYPFAVLYVVAENGDLNWYRNEQSSQPGGSTGWQGPLTVGNGWDRFISVFSGGDEAIYAVQQDGVLFWYGHDGCFDGSPRWRDRREVGHGWQNFRAIVPGGEYVIYAIRSDGALLWYRHDGARSGGDVTTWVGGHPVNSGWAGFTKVCSGGGGIIYAVRPDGVLMRYKHRGYLTGTNDWAEREEIGTGWDGFRDVVAAYDGVIYALTHDGRILWYRYGPSRRSHRRAPPTTRPRPGGILVDKI